MTADQLDLIPRPTVSFVPADLADPMPPPVTSDTPGLCVSGMHIRLLHDWPVRRGPCKICGAQYPNL